MADFLTIAGRAYRVSRTTGASASPRDILVGHESRSFSGRFLSTVRAAIPKAGPFPLKRMSEDDYLQLLDDLGAAGIVTCGGTALGANALWRVRVTEAGYVRGPTASDVWRAVSVEMEKV